MAKKMAKQPVKAKPKSLTGLQVYELLIKLPGMEQASFLKRLESDDASLVGQVFNDTNESMGWGREEG